MKQKKKKEQKLSELLKERSLLKQDVYETSKQLFSELKQLLSEELEKLGKEIKDERVRLKFEDKGDFEAYAFVGSDVLVFNMHTNIFSFPDEHAVHKTSYVSEDFSRAYCGVFNIYNFLADSFLHNRMNDQGYLLGRIFVNKEQHFMMEGSGDLGVMFKDFIHGELDKANLRKIIQIAIRQAAEFDLLTPPYDVVQLVSVMQIQALSSSLQMKTAKRLGFKFQADQNKII